MNNTLTSQTTQYFFRRLEGTFPFTLPGSVANSGWLWLWLVLTPILLVAFIYVAITYVRAGIALASRQDWGVFSTLFSWVGLTATWASMGAGVSLLIHLMMYGGSAPTWVWVAPISIGAALGLAVGGLCLLVLGKRHPGALVAFLLGSVRIAIYLVLSVIFLLPAERQIERTETRSKIVVLFDVSGSMETKDDLPTPEVPFESLKTRQQKVLDVLAKTSPVDENGTRLTEKEADEAKAAKKKVTQADFLQRLEMRNPVTMYRFGSRVDDAFLVYDRNLYSGKIADPAELSKVCAADLMSPYLHTWLRPTITPPKDQVPPQDLKDQIEELQRRNKDMAGSEVAFFSRTALGDAALTVLAEEIKNNQVQGLVIYTDGRDNSGASKAFSDLRKEAERKRVPIFVVGLGVPRPRVRLDVKSLQVQTELLYNESFPVETEIQGDGGPLLEKETRVKVQLEVMHVRFVPGQKDEERLDIELIEDITQPDKKEGEQPKPKEGEQPKPMPAGPEPARLSLGKLLTFDKEAVLSRTPPPTVTLNFGEGADGDKDKKVAMSAKVLLDRYLAVHKIDMTNPVNKAKYDKKWALAPTPDSYLRFRTSVPKHELEVWPDPLHYSDNVDVRVVRKKLRVLLFAGGPSREFQYVRNLIARETQKDQMELSVYVQQHKGNDPQRLMAMKQDTLQKRYLSRFPVMLEGKKRTPRSADDKDADYVPSAEEIKTFKFFETDIEAADKALYDLDSYDVIIAFDPDWSELEERMFPLLSQWVKAGGGLVFVGGGINTLELGKPDSNRNKYKTLLDLLPVELADLRKFLIEIKSDRPWPLDTSEATDDLDFLTLLEASDFEKAKEELRKADEKKEASPYEWARAYRNTPYTFLLGWEMFFGRDAKEPTKVERGFHSVYPIRDIKPGARVVARYTDPGVPEMEGTRGDGGEAKRGKQPFFVVWDVPPSGRRVWIGSGETWRLRTGPSGEAFFERFWTKVTRYAGARSQREAKKKILVAYDKRAKANERPKIGAEIVSKSGQRLAEGVVPLTKFEPVDLFEPDERIRFKLEQMPSDVPADIPDDQKAKWKEELVTLKKDFERLRRELDEVRGRDDDASLSKIKDLKTELGKLEAKLDEPRYLPRMSAVVGKPGKFNIEFKPRLKGRYGFEVKVPSEGLGTDQKMMYIEPDDPELDDLRPDFRQMYDMASEFSLVEPRLKKLHMDRLRDDKKADERVGDLKETLRKGRPKVEGADGKLTDLSAQETQRLYFNLDNAELITECIPKHIDAKETRGKSRDLWDEGFSNLPYWYWGGWMYVPLPGKVPTIMLGVVLLFSVEWLIRKLLRLA